MFFEQFWNSSVVNLILYILQTSIPYSGKFSEGKILETYHSQTLWK